MRGYVLTVEDILALYGSELNIKEETRRTLRPDGFQFYLESYVRAILYRRGRRPRRPERKIKKFLRRGDLWSPVF